MSEILRNLENQTAIITGAAQGIGRAIAERLARAGARVAVSDLNLKAAQATASEIGTSATAIQADVSKAAEVDQMVHALLEQWGRIDILINNAGIVGRDVPVKDLTEADWDQVLDINLKGTFLCSRAVIGPMIDRKQGAIVSIASISGKEGNPSMAPYSVSKAGVICFTKALAKEVIGDGIRVNCVSPALIQTPLLDKIEQDQLDWMTSKIPLGRLGRPEEVAALVHFLASEDASFTTGQCYDISGGRATY
ncbi:MAG: SDR family NAD(P)-dependent oxidoreductase [bacterium]|nr:SDR family NAD(P)-dependent oxidoreductase [bacterium]